MGAESQMNGTHRLLLRAAYQRGSQYFVHFEKQGKTGWYIWPFNALNEWIALIKPNQRAANEGPTWNDSFNWFHSNNLHSRFQRQKMARALRHNFEDRATLDRPGLFRKICGQTQQMADAPSPSFRLISKAEKKSEAKVTISCPFRYWGETRTNLGLDHFLFFFILKKKTKSIDPVRYTSVCRGGLDAT